jgi:hypothetical protein
MFKNKVYLTTTIIIIDIFILIHLVMGYYINYKIISSFLFFYFFYFLISFIYIPFFLIRYNSFHFYMLGLIWGIIRIFELILSISIVYKNIIWYLS